MSNFDFIAQYDNDLADLAKKAEEYLHDDPNTCLIKVRQYTEILAQYVAIRSGIPEWERDNQMNLLNVFQHRGVFGPTAISLFHGIRKAGNKAVHGGHDSQSEALHQLMMAWKLSVVVHRILSNNQDFDPKFKKPSAKKHNEEEVLMVKEAAAKYHAQAEAYKKELEDVRATLKVVETNFKSKGKEEEAQKEATETRKRIYQESKVFEAESQPNALSLDETATRRLIDDQLRDAGWDADTENLRYSTGARPERHKYKAIAEWPTDSGPADYALFHGLKLLAIVEAKKMRKDVKSALGQSKRYSKTISPKGEEEFLGKWGEFNIPFLFATNGRPYLEQLKIKSGIWFLDVRLRTNLERPLTGWPTPEDLLAEFKKQEEVANKALQDESKDYLPLRDFQKTAIDKVEGAIRSGQREILVAMATGTGKTRTCIGLAYRLIKSGRFRRILFLVDRTSLGDQADGAFKEVKIEENKSFSQFYEIKELDDIKTESDTKIHFSTVQGLVRRTLYPSREDEAPIPVSQYDCIIIDECHRGYTMDKELSDEEFDYRDEQDYISKYKRVIEHFDAVKIGLTATPALHTKEIFGEPVYKYSYREAVIDGWLVDHHEPYRIKTKLSEEGMKWKRGETVRVYDPTTATVEEIDNLPDQLELEIEDFNTKVITENFNKAVCTELAKHIEWDSDEKTVIFCARDDHADMVVDQMKKAFQEVQGEVDQEAVMKITAAADVPKDAIKRFKNEKFPSVAVTVDLLSTGIDVPEICNIVFIRRVRSRILYSQMIGRGTRLCEKIGKDHFNIFDAVNLYSTLKDFTDMKPVTPNPSVTFEDLTSELKKQDKEATKKHIIDQIVAKLNLRKRRIKGNKLEEFKTIMDGSEPEEVIEDIRNPRKLTEKDWFKRFEHLSRWLDKLKQEAQRMIISEHEDEVIAVEQGYGDNQKPEDYIEGFARYVKENMSQVQALNIITQRPKDLTRQQLRELKLILDEKGYTTEKLQRAYKDATNKDIAASIIGFIRKETIGDPLKPFEKRLEEAIERIKSVHNFTNVQLKWIDRIAKQISKEIIVDRDALDKGVFKLNGGYNRANRTFDGKIDKILDEIHDNMWHSTAG